MARKAKFPLGIEIRGIDKITGPARQMSRQVGATLSSLQATAKRLSGIAVGGAGALFAIAKSTALAGDNIAKTSKRLGIGVEALQEYRFAAERSGIEANVFDMAMQRMGRRVGEAAKGMGEARGALAELGISATDASGQVRTIESLLPEVAKKLSRMSSASARNALAMKLFDSEGVKMVQLLGEGAEGMAALRREARELGNVLSKEEVAAAEQFEDAWTNLTFTFKGVKNAIGSALLPVLKDLSERMRSFIIENLPRIRKFAKEFAEGLPEKLEQIRAGFVAVVRQLEPFVKAAAAVVKKVGGVKFALGALGTILLGPLIANIVKLAASFTKLGIAIGATGIGGWVVGIGLAIAAVVLLVQHWDEVTAAIERASKAWDEFIGHKSETGIFEDIKKGNWESMRRRMGIPTLSEIGLEPPRDSQTKVQIDINGAPPGTRASVVSGDGVSELNLGVSMQGGTR